jgi:hypothetical protein
MPKHRTKASTAKPELSFADFATERDWWSVTATGGYADDCNKGVRQAEEFLRHFNRDHGERSELGWIVRDMIAKGRFTGLEVGFFSRISDALPDHPLLRLTSDQSVPPFTKALFEKRYAEQTRAHREKTGQHRLR